MSCNDKILTYRIILSADDTMSIKLTLLNSNKNWIDKLLSKSAISEILLIN